jgi:heme/copper-type cytochrome/quinol oxidase subunit 2
MEKKRKGIQVYAIIVSIIAIITFIISVIILVAAIIDRSDPISSGYSRTNLSSFENYKMEVMKPVKKDQAYIPNDGEIKKMYDAAKEEKVSRVLHNTKRDLIVTVLLILISIAFFVTHWQIIKKSSQPEDSGSA